MENFELYIPTTPRRKNGYFPKGHKPFNKGIPQSIWMDGRKIRKVRKYLEIGRRLGNGKYLAGHNKKRIVGIKNGILTAFPSISDAARILKSKGIKVSARNICAVCHGKIVKNVKYSYIRKRAGGYQWFFAEETEKYMNLLHE